MSVNNHSSGLDCPSAQPNMADARILGVITSTEEGPRVAYLNAVQPVTNEYLALAGSFPPSRVMRFAARCQEQKCTHFDGENCQLAARIVERMAEVSATLPPCTIRRTCRWHAQEGAAACARCPQVVTYHADPTPELAGIALPSPGAAMDQPA